MRKTEDFLENVGLKWIKVESEYPGVNQIAGCLSLELVRKLIRIETFSDQSKEQLIADLKNELFYAVGYLQITDSEKFQEKTMQSSCSFNEITTEVVEASFYYYSRNGRKFNWAKNQNVVMGGFEKIKTNKKEAQSWMKGYEIKKRFAPDQAEKDLFKHYIVQMKKRAGTEITEVLNQYINEDFFEALQEDCQTLV